MKCLQSYQTYQNSKCMNIHPTTRILDLTVEQLQHVIRTANEDLYYKASAGKTDDFEELSLSTASQKFDITPPTLRRWAANAPNLIKKTGKAYRATRANWKKLLDLH